MSYRRGYQGRGRQGKIKKKFGDDEPIEEKEQERAKEEDKAGSLPDLADAEENVAPHHSQETPKALKLPAVARQPSEASLPQKQSSRRLSSVSDFDESDEDEDGDGAGRPRRGRRGAKANKGARKKPGQESGGTAAGRSPLPARGAYASQSTLPAPTPGGPFGVGYGPGGGGSRAPPTFGYGGNVGGAVDNFGFGGWMSTSAGYGGYQKPLLPPQLAYGYGQKNGKSNFLVGVDISNDPDSVQEAKRVAMTRLLLLDDQRTGVEGPDFDRHQWEFYRALGRWSDHLMGSLGSIRKLPMLLLPCGWWWRLFLNISRAAPFKANVTGCGSMTLQTWCACPVASYIFLIPLVGYGLLFWFLNHDYTNNRTLGGFVGYLNTQFGPFVLFNVLVMLIVIQFAMTIWSRVILGIGVKYQIVSVMDRPNTFTRKACCCLCPMNQRVGLHVDRAQGFLGVDKDNKELFQLSKKLFNQLVPKQLVMEAYGYGRDKQDLERGNVVEGVP